MPDKIDVTDLTAPSGMPTLVLEATKIIHDVARGMGDADEVRTAQIVGSAALIGQAVVMLAVAITGDPRLVQRMPLGPLSTDITREATRLIIAAAHAVKES